MPQLFSFLGASLLVYLNIFSVVGVFGFFYPIYKNTNKFYALLLMLIIAFLNYILLYRNKYYEEVFTSFDKSKGKYKRWDKTVPIYIIGSVVLLLIVLAISDYRYDGHF